MRVGIAVCVLLVGCASRARSKPNEGATPAADHAPAASTPAEASTERDKVAATDDPVESLAEPTEDESPSPRCSVQYLEAWRDEVVAAAPPARRLLLEKAGLQVTDPDDHDRDAPWHAAEYVRNAQIHRIELGGPPGLESVVEVELAGTEALDERHARSVVQVFVHGEEGTLCGVLAHGELSASLVGESRPAWPAPNQPPLPWGPQAIAFVELLEPGIFAIEVRRASGHQGEDMKEASYTISYWAFDSNAELKEVFGPFVTFAETNNGESMIQASKVEGTLRTVDRGWPKQLRTEQLFTRLLADESVPERSRERHSWSFSNGVYERSPES